MAIIVIRAAEDVPPRTVHQQAIEHALHAGHFRGNVLPQAGVVAQVLRLDAADDPLGVGHQAVELLVAADVELAEPLEELGQVLDRTSPGKFSACRPPGPTAARSSG